MTKVIKVKLVSDNDDIIGYKEVNAILWELQKEAREIANRIVQLIWEYDGVVAEWKNKSGDYPKKEEHSEIFGSTNLQSLLYSEVKGSFPLQNTSNMSSIVQLVMSAYKKRRKDILRGDMSIPSYRKDFPIELHNKNIKLTFDKESNGGVKDWFVTIALLSRFGKQNYKLDKGSLNFKIIVPAKAKGSVGTILERCYDGVYKISGSKLQYEDGKWYLLLSYSFEKDVDIKELPRENIMGVHIGEHNAVSIAFNNSPRTFCIEGGEVKSFSSQIEKRRRSIGMATKKGSELCGDGRIGRGYHRKMVPLEQIGQKVTNFRNTVNHRYSHQIVKWALENDCGTIQIEDLTGLASSELQKRVYLKDWSYYDLTSKIEYKAKEHGINVVKVGYKELRKWCSVCETSTCRKSETDNEITYECDCGHVFDADRDVLSALIKDDIDEILKSSVIE